MSGAPGRIVMSHAVVEIRHVNAHAKGHSTVVPHATVLRMIHKSATRSHVPVRKRKYHGPKTTFSSYHRHFITSAHDLFQVSCDMVDLDFRQVSIVRQRRLVFAATL